MPSKRISNAIRLEFARDALVHSTLSGAADEEADLEGRTANRERVRFHSGLEPLASLLHGRGINRAQALQGVARAGRDACLALRSES